MPPESSSGVAAPAPAREIADRLAGAPISWGVCEVPGWGLQLPPERVLAEMAALGLRATELGPQGWLPEDGAHVRELADLVSDHGLMLVLHPHVGTLAETAADVEGALAHTDVPWCLDTGHLLIGGVDPVQFVRDHGERLGHVH